MTAPELADCWIPVPLRWRHVQPGDVIVGKDGRLHYVTESRRAGGTWSCNVHGYGLVYPMPDEVATVLMLATERDALTTVRDILGGQLTERRTAA